MLRQIFCCLRLKVQSGPFRGLNYLPQSTGSALPPKLMGVYEKELHQTIRKWISYAPRNIIDIGAAEGYYAVGLAVALPTTKITAFEQNAEGQRMLGEMAALNNIRDRIQIKGLACRNDLINMLKDDPYLFIIMDIEGGEHEFFDYEIVKSSINAHLLIEIHKTHSEQQDPFGDLEDLFKKTHIVRKIFCDQRSIADLPFFPWRILGHIFKRKCLNALDEKRLGSLGWLSIEPRNPSCDV